MSWQMETILAVDVGFLAILVLSHSIVHLNMEDRIYILRFARVIESSENIK